MGVEKNPIRLRRQIMNGLTEGQWADPEFMFAMAQAFDALGDRAGEDADTTVEAVRQDVADLRHYPNDYPGLLALGEWFLAANRIGVKA